MILNMIMPDMTPSRKPPEPSAEFGCSDPGLPPGGGVRIVDSRDLLAGGEDLLIRHEGRLYRLRRTRLGKLILTA